MEGWLLAMEKKSIRIAPYSEYTDFALASAYFNRIKYMTDEEVSEERDNFWTEVDKRRGDMLRSEWLEYNY